MTDGLGRRILKGLGLAAGGLLTVVTVLEYVLGPALGVGVVSGGIVMVAGGDARGWILIGIGTLVLVVLAGVALAELRKGRKNGSTKGPEKAGPRH